MHVYNNNGNLTNTQAADTARDIRNITIALYEKLFADGMTVLEGRALMNYLTSAVDFASVITISKHELTRIIKDRVGSAAGEGQIGEGQIDSPNGDA